MIHLSCIAQTSNDRIM